MRVRVLLSSPNSSVNNMCACKNQCKLYIDQSIYIHIYINQQITVSHFGEHKRLHLESSKQNYYIISLTSLILIAFITGNSSLEPLIEGLCAQIHVNLR